MNYLDECFNTWMEKAFKEWWDKQYQREFDETALESRGFYDVEFKYAFAAGFKAAFDSEPPEDEAEAAKK